MVRSELAEILQNAQRAADFALLQSYAKRTVGLAREVAATDLRFRSLWASVLLVMNWSFSYFPQLCFERTYLQEIEEVSAGRGLVTQPFELQFAVAT